jgi:ribonuclease HI
MNQNITTIFTDGSSRGNPGPGGWGAVVRFASGEIVELGGGERKTTNNRMELTAIIEALQCAHEKGHAAVYTDSQYAINGITKWVDAWQRNGWMTKAKQPVLNKDLWERLAELVGRMRVQWNHVEGHVGVVGNERADAIATAFADETDIDLFVGEANHYRLDLSRVTVDKGKRDEKKRKSAKAFSYLSLVDGEVERHHTWAECKARVEGKRGVKYRKTISLEDEKSIINEWHGS